MAGVISGYNKIDVAIAAASSAFTTPYYDMGMYDKAIFIVTAGTMGSSENIGVVLNSAVSSTGSGAAALGTATTIGSTTALACDVRKACAVIMEGASTNCSSGWTVAINSITFTGYSTATTDSFNATRTFASSSNGGVSTQCYDHLAAYINHATYGCTGLFATAASTVLTITASPPGEKLITTQLSASSGALIWPTKSVGILECHSNELSAASSMRYLALVATPSIAANVNKMACVLIRSGARYSPDTTGLVSAYDRDI